jgi:hypothetical protein
VIRRFDVDGRPAPHGVVSVGDGRRRFPGALPWLLGPGVAHARVRHLEAPPPGADGQPRIKLALVQRGAPPTAAVSAETRERLRALGYLP